MRQPLDSFTPLTFCFLEISPTLHFIGADHINKPNTSAGGVTYKYFIKNIKTEDFFTL